MRTAGPDRSFNNRGSRSMKIGMGLMLLMAAAAMRPVALVGAGNAEKPRQAGLYFSSMQFLGKTPQNFSINEGYEFLTVIETLLGWILMALFLVTMSRVMLR